MILIFEMIWTNAARAPADNGTIRTVAQALPAQDVQVYAGASRLAELQNDPALVDFRRVSFRSTPVLPHFRYRTNIASVRGGLRESLTMWRALREAVPGEPCLLFLIFATPTAIWAASVIIRIDGRVAGVQTGLHGNGGDISAWRSRNPAVRHFDLRSAMSRRRPRILRYLVLEEAIRQELRQHLPETAQCTDVLPLPVNQSEVACAPPAGYSLPLRIALVGQATEAKDITTRLNLASNLKVRYGDRPAFEVIGFVPEGGDLSRFLVLDVPVTHEPPSRQAFRAKACSRALRLFAICAELLQSVRQWCVYRRNHLAQAGNRFPASNCRGCVCPLRRFLCDSTGDMLAPADGLVSRPNPDRYARQIDALRRARDACMPAALASDYRRIVEQNFPRPTSASRVTPDLGATPTGTGE